MYSKKLLDCIPPYLFVFFVAALAHLLSSFFGALLIVAARAQRLKVLYI